MKKLTEAFVGNLLRKKSFATNTEFFEKCNLSSSTLNKLNIVVVSPGNTAVYQR